VGFPFNFILTVAIIANSKPSTIATPTVTAFAAGNTAAAGL
jgi:hypothetical protein